MERTQTETIEPATHSTGHGHREPTDHERIDLNVPRPRPVWVVIMALLGIGALAALLATGWFPRQRNEKELASDAADAAIRDGHADAIAFGRIFISNPDLPRRLQRGFPLTPYNRATFYGGDVAGYTDYPEHNELAQA